MQLVIAATDLLIAATILFVLLPKSDGVTFGYFLTVYLLAVVTVLFTHVPAGAGVLELVVLVLLAPKQPAALLGGILAFRVVYYLLPLALAMILLAGHEVASAGMKSAGSPRRSAAGPLPLRRRCCRSSWCWPVHRCCLPVRCRPPTADWRGSMPCCRWVSSKPRTCWGASAGWCW